ncbi:MAG: SpoIIE family protein phosphatase [Verrucomicrobiae bacterium]|nr:SpoIIE family protein phosphatase [Verrucomicrobiae bacterium]
MSHSKRSQPTDPTLKQAANGERPDLSRMRHELRTPINHILGYCEMLMEEGQIPAAHAEDLRRIHAGGRELQVLIGRYFDEEQFFQQRDLHQLYHELRTPVNHIIGYSDLLIEHADDPAMQGVIPDLKKIREAAVNWLALMEAYLIEPVLSSAAGTAEGSVPTPQAIALNLGFTFKVPEPKSARSAFHDEGAILVVDDDESSREMLARRLRRCGYTVSAVPGGLQALALARSQEFDLVLLDMIMPGLDGFQVLAKFKADPELHETPVIMLSALDEENGIARCIEMGAEDYLAKPFNSVFLRARIGACLEKKRLRDRERQTYEALLQSQKHLAGELAEAAGYVSSLLPPPLEEPVKLQWRFQPSAELGGDIFGYHWINPEQLAVYLLDVSGHGVGAALLSVSVLNVLRAQSLPGTDFGDPAAVLKQLNHTFRMEQQHNLLFTIWYGVFDRRKREVRFASGGHPPALLVESTGARQLSTGGRLIGCDPEAEFRSASCVVAPGSRLYVFSDGAYEISRPDGSTLQLTDLVAELNRPRTAGRSKLDEFVAWAEQSRGERPLEDDLSILEIEF